MLARCSLIPRCILFFKTVYESEFLYASHLLTFGSRQPYCYPKYSSQTYIIYMPYHSLLIFLFQFMFELLLIDALIYQMFIVRRWQANIVFWLASMLTFVAIF